MGGRTVAVAGAIVLTTACSPPGGSAPPAGRSAIAFIDGAPEAGLDFVHVNGMSGRLYEAEIMGSGAALLDFDNDGDLDVYLVQGGPLGAGASATGVRPLVHRDRLYRNDRGPSEVSGLRFTDVTAESLPVMSSYGMGVATGDFDNDGWVDLLLTRLGDIVLLRNTTRGTFDDVTRSSRLSSPGWNVPAAFADIDRDGWLDLFVGQYLDYSLDTDISCQSRSAAPDYCDPSVYRPVRHRLFRNLRDGTFSDVSASALRGDPVGAALGVATFDANRDGWTDIYVANDRRENHLWMNQRDGTFVNAALEAGVAVNGRGRPEASMGVDAGDMDNDGDDDIVIANLASEGATLYLNDGGGIFEDAGASSGVRPASLARTGFGAGWLDADNDGWLDLLMVNGAVQLLEPLVRTGDPFPLHERKQLFRNLRNGRFEDVTASAGAVFGTSEVGRGAAFGDIDNDGDVDVLVNVNNGPVQLLINATENENHWVGLRLVGSAVRRDMLGAHVEITGDGVRLMRRARSDGSYASANDPRVLVGLAAAATPVTVRVSWPGGRVESWSNVATDRWTTIVEGTGQ